MQISNNLHSQPSKNMAFGMALKITKPAVEALEKSDMKTIEKLTKIGEELADTKFYHLEIGEDLKPRIDSVYAGSYVKEFSPVEPHDEFLSINTVWDGTEFENIRKGMPFKTTIKFDTKEAALDAYKKLKSTTNDIDKAAELTKMFEQRAVKREAESSAAYKEKINVKNAVAKLMERFGGEAHIK